MQMQVREVLAMYGERFPVMPEGLEMKLFSGPDGYSAEVFRSGEAEPFWSAEGRRARQVLRKVRKRFVPRELDPEE
jgi:hypothetical protein